MDSSLLFFLTFFAVILITRIWLFLKPVSSPTINGFRMHHWMYGAIGIPVSLFIGSLVLYAISLALFIDEFTFILMKGKSHKDNYSFVSLIGTGVFIMIVFLLRNYLVNPF